MQLLFCVNWGQQFFQLQTKTTWVTTEQWLNQYSVTKSWCNIIFPMEQKTGHCFILIGHCTSNIQRWEQKLLLFYPHQSSLLLNGLLLMLLLLDYTNKSTRRWWSSTQLPLFSAVRKDGQDVFRNMINKPLLGRDFFQPSSPRRCCVIEVCWSPQMNGMDMAWRNVVESSFGDSLKNHEGFLLSSSSTVLLYYLLQNRFILAFLPSFLSTWKDLSTCLLFDH